MSKCFFLGMGVLFFTLSSCDKNHEETKRQIEQIADNK
jgi:hypothetical protein